MDSSDSNCKEIKLVPEIKTLESAPEENSDFEIFIGNQSDNDEKPLKFIGYDPEEETRKTETKFVIPGYKEREKKPVIKWIKVRVSVFGIFCPTLELIVELRGHSTVSRREMGAR